MKKNKIIYWASTIIIAVLMLFSAYNYFTNESMKSAMVHLGFPDYFRIELGVAKVLGSLVLLIPATTGFIKRFAYSGFALVFISASIAHLAVGDDFAKAFVPLIFL